MQSLDGRVALVTGASRGIGASIARALDAAGVRLGLASRSGDDLGIAGAVARPADVRDPAALVAIANETAQRFGKLDILIVNAGVGAYGPILDVPDDQLEAPVLQCSHHDRLQQPYLPDRFDQLAHRVLVKGLARLTWIRRDGIDGDLSESRAGDREQSVVRGAVAGSVGNDRCFTWNIPTVTARSSAVAIGEEDIDGGAAGTAAVLALPGRRGRYQCSQATAEATSTLAHGFSFVMCPVGSAEGLAPRSAISRAASR
mgnify:CR=1 FL=1